MIWFVADPVRRYLARRTDPDTAEEVISEVMLVSWRRLKRIPPPPESVPWAIGVARNCLRNAERSHRRRSRLVSRIIDLDPSTDVIDPPPVPLLALPILFTAAMTLGDTCNGLFMLRMYKTAHTDPGPKLNYNLLVTGVSIGAAIVVSTVATATLLTEEAGARGGVLQAIAGLDTTYAGYLLVALFAGIGVAAALAWRRGRAGGPR